MDQSTQNGSTKRSRAYLKFTLIQQAQAAKYAIENGNTELNAHSQFMQDRAFLK